MYCKNCGAIGHGAGECTLQGPRVTATLQFKQPGESLGKIKAVKQVNANLFELQTDKVDKVKAQLPKKITRPTPSKAPRVALSSRPVKKKSGGHSVVGSTLGRGPKSAGSNPVAHPKKKQPKVMSAYDRVKKWRLKHKAENNKRQRAYRKAKRKSK